MSPEQDLWSEAHTSHHLHSDEMLDRDMVP
jgi:hypothetical protein